MSSLCPSIPPPDLRSLFDEHAKPSLPQRMLGARAFSAAVFAAHSAAQSHSHAAPPARRQAWDVPASQRRQQAQETAHTIAPRAASSGAGGDAVVTQAALELALSQLADSLAHYVSVRGSGAALTRATRLTMHGRQADAAERQLALLQLLRAVEPRGATLTEGQLHDALAPLGRSTGAASSASSSAFLRSDVVRALWRRAKQGRVEALLNELSPVPVARSSVAAGNGDAAAAEPPDTKHAGGALLNGPFDRGSGRPGDSRRGARYVAPPTSLPSLVKYRHCRTPLLLPADFDPNLVTRSAQMPAATLERKRVLGYNGLGKHNRSPNLFTLNDGCALFCTAGIAVLEDVATSAQSFYDGHDDDIVCVALHPNGELVATGQGNTAGGPAACLHVWSTKTLKAVSRVGQVLDEKINDGVTTKPFYPGSLCACAFGPDGKLLIGVGKDEQHLVGVWDWKRGELLAKAPGLVARPLGVHQLAVAPAPLSVDAQGRRTLMFTLVGVANAPKFGTLTPAAGTGPTRWQLTFEAGKLGVKTPPASLSCVAYGGEAFPSPSGAKHGLTFVGGAFGGIYTFDAPANTTALSSVKAHDGPITTLCFTGSCIASGGADGCVHLWAAAGEGGKGGGGLEKIHTYSFRAVDQGKDPGARALTPNVSNPNHLVEPPKPSKVEKTPVAASATKPATSLPTGSNGGIGAIRSLCLVPLGSKRAVAGNRRVQIPTLYAGTARCSLWRLEPQGGKEIAAGHFGNAAAVAPHPTESGAWASCGADRQLLLWTAAQRLPAQRLTLRMPACSVAYSADGGLIAVGLADGSLTVLRPSTSRGGGRASSDAAATAAAAPASYPSGGSGPIEALAFAPGSSGARGGLLACGSRDRIVRVLELIPEASAAGGKGGGAPRLKLVPRCTCSGHTASVTHLDWSLEGTMLMSNCAAHEILCWAIPSGKRLGQPGRALASAAWASWTCYLGLPVMGIWPEASNSTDVNACHRSADGSLVLVGGDTSGVQLFNAPCVVEGAPFAMGTGHSSAVTGVRFLRGDRMAVSSGGNDRAIMLWDLKDKAGRGSTRALTAALPNQPERFCLKQLPPTG